MFSLRHQITRIRDNIPLPGWEGLVLRYLNFVQEPACRQAGNAVLYRVLLNNLGYTVLGEGDTIGYFTSLPHPHLTSPVKGEEALCQTARVI